MITSLPKWTKGSSESARTLCAAISSCAGVGAAATIYVAHGSGFAALLMFGSMQIWGILDLILRLRSQLRYARLHDFLVRKAAEYPDNLHFRTLLVDAASTYFEDPAERPAVRSELK